MMRHAHPFGWQKAQWLLCFLCIGCALFLIILTLDGRTIWSEAASSPPPKTYIRDNAGWDWLARGAGVLAIVALSIGLYTRRRLLVIACTASASVFLAWAAYAAWQYSQDIAQGLVAREGWTVRTPEQIDSAAQLAAFASMIALVLLLLNIGSAVKRAQSG